ncbi:hypothetical protein HDU85_001902 [Gaertneriomyces sp. JEL0708]|nr:hypothetical protein HDU85_001902 [Gaertneriomyces sp. JEL0708]
MRERGVPSTMRFRPSSMLVVVLLCLAMLAHTAHAFDFSSFFGGSEQEDASHKQQQQQRRSQSNFGSCQSYICPGTNICASKPADCPCPRSTDVKCPVGDWYICIRGDQKCESIRHAPSAERSDL